MTPCNTMFHELLRLIRDYLPDESRLAFYEELFHILGKYSIKLDFLVGEDHRFDEAMEKRKTNL